MNDKHLEAIEIYPNILVYKNITFFFNIYIYIYNESNNCMYSKERTWLYRRIYKIPLILVIVSKLNKYTYTIQYLSNDSSNWEGNLTITLSSTWFVISAEDPAAFHINEVNLKKFYW